MQTLTTAANQPVTLGRVLGKGGEGIVYEVQGHSNIVAKVYHGPKRTPAQQQKIEAMLANPPDDATRRFKPPHVSIAWPSDLLFENRSFAGFLMPRVNDRTKIVSVYNVQLRQKQHAHFNWQGLHRVGSNLATALNALHTVGYVVGDVNQNNVMVTKRALVSLVDTDSFQVKDQQGNVHRCRVGVPEYTPPELQGTRLDSVDQLASHDQFRLAVMVFQLLMEGYHPFTGTTAANVSVGRVDVYCIRQGIFPYHTKGMISPPGSAPAFTTLHPQLQQFFIRAFVDGHADPSKRPSANEWIHALIAAEKDLVECATVPGHYHASHISDCPWCKRAAATHGSSVPVQQPWGSSQPPPPVRPVQQAGGWTTIAPGGTPPIRKTPGSSGGQPLRKSYPRRLVGAGMLLVGGLFFGLPWVMDLAQDGPTQMRIGRAGWMSPDRPPAEAELRRAPSSAKPNESEAQNGLEAVALALSGAGSANANDSGLNALAQEFAALDGNGDARSMYLGLLAFIQGYFGNNESCSIRDAVNIIYQANPLWPEMTYRYCIERLVGEIPRNFTQSAGYNQLRHLHPQAELVVRTQIWPSSAPVATATVSMYDTACWHAEQVYGQLTSAYNRSRINQNLNTVRSRGQLRNLQREADRLSREEAYRSRAGAAYEEFQEIMESHETDRKSRVPR